MRKLWNILLWLLDQLGRLQTGVWLWTAVATVMALATSTYLTAPRWAVFLSVIGMTTAIPLLVIAWKLVKQDDQKKTLTNPASATVDPQDPIVRRLTERYGIRQSESGMRDLAKELRHQRMYGGMVKRLMQFQPAPLKIEFQDGDNLYRHVGRQQGHGINQGQRQSYIVVIHNTGTKSVRGVEVSLTDIDPLPPEFTGKLPLPLRFEHQETDHHSMDFAGGQKRPVAVVSCFDSFWQANISIEHAVRDLPKDIYHGDENGYEIEISVTGLGVSSPKPRRFKIGVKDRNLYMFSFNSQEATSS